MTSGNRFPVAMLALALAPAVCVGGTYVGAATGMSRPAVGDFIEVRPDAPFAATAEAAVISGNEGPVPGMHCTIRTGAEAPARGSLLIVRREASGAYLAHWQADAAAPHRPDCGASADLRLDVRAVAALWSSNLLEAIYARVLPPADAAMPFG